jgi:hypothetical protein
MMRRWIRAAQKAAKRGVPSAGNLPYPDEEMGADMVPRSVSRTRPRWVKIDVPTVSAECA